MAQLYLLLIGASFLGYLSDRKTNFAAVRYPKKDFWFYLLTIILICFIGLRTSMNDTYAYMNAFNRLEPFSNIDWAIGSNPLFLVYESFIKQYISSSSYTFIFITSFFTVSVYTSFLKKHSVNFGYSIFLLIALGVYGFTAAAIKQTLATAIALIAVDRYLSGGKILPVVLLGCAVLFHPYVIIYAVVPFLTDEIWQKKSLMIILVTFIIGSNFSAFLGNVLEVTSAIGENYSISSFDSDTGVNILRVLVYAVTPVLSFIYKEEIRIRKDKMMFLAVNLSLLTSCFSVLSLFGGAVAVGRMSRYFDIFQCIVLPYILKKCIQDERISKIIFYASIGCFIIYYYYYYKNYTGLGFFTDYYNRISISTLLANW